MKRQFGLALACGALLLASGSVLAGPRDHGRDHGSSWHGEHGHDRGHDHDHDRGRGHDHGDYRHDHDRHVYRERHYAGMHDRGRHEGWYRRGGRLPVVYRERTYVVTDWHRAHLREPRRGYHWVRSDNGDFLLVAITTGVILDILAH